MGMPRRPAKFSGLWRSLVAHAVRDREAVGSNPANPTAEGSAQWWATGLENRAGVKPEGSTPLPSSNDGDDVAWRLIVGTGRCLVQLHVEQDRCGTKVCLQLWRVHVQG